MAIVTVQGHRQVKHGDVLCDKGQRFWLVISDNHIVDFYYLDQTGSTFSATFHEDTHLEGRLRVIGNIQQGLAAMYKKLVEVYE